MMRLNKSSAILFLVCFFAGSCATSNPALIAAMDQEAARVRQKDQSYAAGDSSDHKALAAGQWTKYSVSNEKGQIVSFVTTRLLEVDERLRTTEVEMQSKDIHSVSEFVMDPGEEGDFKDIEILRAVTKEKGQEAHELSEIELAIGGAFWKNILKSVQPEHFVSQGKEEVRVPAGTFLGADKVDSSLDVTGKKIHGSAWIHPAVPLSGAVKTVNDHGKSELVDFGFDAKSTMAQF
ncbi:MAG: hypothetical protein IPJ88_16815 [Myxococcales bacterium]|nr:MAG: hypothetical protein IPJ88_16815 [Myxococcales bacterium]